MPRRLQQHHAHSVALSVIQVHGERHGCRSCLSRRACVTLLPRPSEDFFMQKCARCSALACVPRSSIKLVCQYTSQMRGSASPSCTANVKKTAGQRIKHRDTYFYAGRLSAPDKRVGSAHPKEGARGRHGVVRARELTAGSASAPRRRASRSSRASSPGTFDGTPRPARRAWPVQ